VAPLTHRTSVSRQMHPNAPPIDIPRSFSSSKMWLDIQVDVSDPAVAYGPMFAPAITLCSLIAASVPPAGLLLNHSLALSRSIWAHLFAARNYFCCWKLLFAPAITLCSLIASSVPPAGLDPSPTPLSTDEFQGISPHGWIDDFTLNL